MVSFSHWATGEADGESPWAAASAVQSRRRGLLLKDPIIRLRFRLAELAAVWTNMAVCGAEFRLIMVHKRGPSKKWLESSVGWIIKLEKCRIYTGQAFRSRHHVQIT